MKAATEHERRRILVVTTCTGRKALHAVLTAEDFVAGAARVAAIEARSPTCPAEDLYTGDQHRLLMDGVRAARAAGHEVDVFIISAGYGLIPGTRRIAGYERTFQGMPKTEAREAGGRLNIPAGLRALLRQAYDLAILAIGADYEAAAGGIPASASPTLALCGAKAKILRRPPASVVPVPIAVSDLGRFGAGQTAVKGAVAGRLLQRLARGETIEEVIAAPLRD